MTITHRIFKDKVEIGHIAKLPKTNFVDYSTDKFTYTVCLTNPDFEGRDALQDAIWDRAYKTDDDNGYVFYHYHNLEDVGRALANRCDVLAVPVTEFDTPNPAIVSTALFDEYIAGFKKRVAAMPTNILLKHFSVIRDEIRERAEAEEEEEADFFTNGGEV